MNENGECHERNRSVLFDNFVKMFHLHFLSTRRPLPQYVPNDFIVQIITGFGLLDLYWFSLIQYDSVLPLPYLPFRLSKEFVRPWQHILPDLMPPLSFRSISPFKTYCTIHKRKINVRQTFMLMSNNGPR